MDKAASPVARLPRALLHDVFKWLAAPSAHREWQRVVHRERVFAALRTLAQVATAWQATARDVSAELTLRVLVLETVDTTATSYRAHLLELRRRATLRRAYLKELELARPPRALRARPFTVDEWSSVVVHAPLLETLQMNRLTRASVVPQCVPVVDAVGRHCPRLKQLHFPSGIEEADYEPPQDTTELLEAVLRGLPKWSSRGGLRRLTLPIPFIRMDGHHVLATTYLKALATHCPRLEFLDGCEDLFKTLDDVVCSEQWHIDTTTWEQFWRSCTQLKTFNWAVVPFATSFFEIFGRNRKPRLETLTLVAPMNWDWDLYRRHYPDLDGGFGGTAVKAHNVLRACPALTTIDVQLYLPGDRGFDPFRERPSVNPRHVMINKEIFGDDFCTAIAVSCKELERLTIWRGLSGTTEPITIQSFTDAALYALAKLPRLTWMQLPSVNITGDGLFALVTGFAHGEWPRQRDYEITVGDVDGTTNSTAFYRVVEQFLNRLAEWDTHEQLPCASERIVLRLLNGCYSHVQRDWSELYLRCLRPLLKLIRRKHPTMRVRMMTRAFGTTGSATGSEGFDHIFEFNFYSANAEINEEYEWEDEHDTVVDEVFVDRGMGPRGNDDFDDYDEASY